MASAAFLLIPNALAQAPAMTDPIPAQTARAVVQRTTQLVEAEGLYRATRANTRPQRRACWRRSTTREHKSIANRCSST
jgi:hypothetical protein